MARRRRCLQVARRTEEGAGPRLQEDRSAQGLPRVLRSRTGAASRQEMSRMMRHVRLTAVAFAAASLLALGGCNREAPSQQSGPAPAPPAPPAAPAPPAPGAARLYVSDETGGNVVVID